MMLRIHLMQQWYGLNAPGMEDSLYDVEAMRRFAGVDIEHIPDESTVLNFRHFLERHGLTERLFEISTRYLSERGLLLSMGMIVMGGKFICTIGLLGAEAKIGLMNLEYNMMQLERKHRVSVSCA